MTINSFRQLYARLEYPELESKAAKDHWLEHLLTPVLQVIGPLDSINSRGNCDYTYSDPERFPGVHDASSFCAWAESYLLEYDRNLATFCPSTAPQRRDLDAIAEYRQALASLVAMARESLPQLTGEHES